MHATPENPVTRGLISLRLLNTLLFMIIFCIVRSIIFLTVIYQFVYLLVTLKHSEPVRTFANKMITYAYQVWRYITLNENRRPYPFSEFPGEMELPSEEVTFP